MRVYYRGNRFCWVRALCPTLCSVLRFLLEVAMSIDDRVVELVCAYYIRRHTKNKIKRNKIK
jgi:hypothetical protein